MKLLSFLLTTFISMSALSFSFEIDAFYFSDSFTNSSTESHTKTLYDLGAYLSLDKGGEVLLGWNYSNQSISDSTASTTSYTLTEMGPKMAYYFDKDKYWGMFLTYNLTATAKYNTGSTVELRGNSYKVSFSYTPEIDDDEVYFLGLKLNYSVASYTESVSGSTLNTISYSRTQIYPSLHFIMHFD